MCDKKFKMYIKAGYFASTVREFSDDKPVHYLCYGKCNCRCEFCSFNTWTDEQWPEYTFEDFEKKVWKLLRVSKNFKFVGGEPTLNPYLKDLIKIVKIYSGKVYLDTNGSRPQVIKELLDENLIDVLGLSLKGLTPEEAMKTANITNQKICWDNLFESLALGSAAKDVRVILTYVACEGYFSDASLERLAELLAPYPNVVLKINNCYNEDKNGGRRKGFEKSEIYKMVESFVERHPEFRDRTTLFTDHDSCVDQNRIVYF